MSTELEEKFVMAIHETRMKYVNVLLVAGAACIGFSVTQTREQALSFWSIPWGVALAFWSSSFFFGCRYIFKRSVLFGINLTAIKVHAGKDPVIGSDSARIKEMLDQLQNGERGYKDTDSATAKLMRWQFNCLIAGACFYIVWHMLEMWRRIPENMCLWV